MATVRAETPGCDRVVHLNNAGASLPPSSVLDAVVEYLEAEARAGGYEIAEDRADDLAAVYDEAVRLFGGTVSNWAFVESATRAWNAAFSALRFEPGDRILTTTSEYPSNMAGLLRASELQGATIEIVPDDESGQVDAGALESMLDDRTRLVSLVHVPTQGGLVNPVEQVGTILRDHPALYQVDGCQSAGQIPLRIEDLGCDIFSFTGRKFLRGPRATGMVWASDAALEGMGNPGGVDMQGSSWVEAFTIEPLPGGARFEPYEVFFAGKVGLAAALRYASTIGVDEIARRNEELATRLRTGLSDLPGVTLHDRGTKQCAIVTFTVEGWDPADVRRELRGQSINVSVSSESSARLDFPSRQLEKVVRASVHYYNLESEVDALVTTVSRMTR